MTTRVPIIAPWLRSARETRAAATQAAARAWYGLWFHLFRVHVYWWRLARQSPVGIWEGIVGVFRFTFDLEGKDTLRAVKSSTSDAKGNVVRVTEDHRNAIRNHLIIDVLVLFVCWRLTAAALDSIGPAYRQHVLVAAGLVTAPIVGWFGRNKDKPVLDQFESSKARPKMTDSLVMAALENSQIPRMKEAFKEGAVSVVRWVRPVSRIPNGYEAVVDLPEGVTAATAIKRASNIASGLQRPASTVWLSEPPEEAGGHAGRLRLVITNQPLRNITVPAWPLANPRSGPFDVFEPIPLGIDPIGDPVYLTMMYRSAVIGAIPRAGKTFTMRLICLAAALDPTCELYVFDLKGGIDLKAFEPLATAFLNRPDDRHAPTVLDALRNLEADMHRREETLDRLADEQPERCPEGKVTRELANDPTLGLHPIVLAIDETQTAFADWNIPEIEQRITRLVKLGPTVGIMTVLATQSVNKTTIPRAISTAAAVRFCLKVFDDKENDQVLGTGAYSRGYKACDLAHEDYGIGYLAGGQGDAIQLVRCFYVSGADAAPIAARALSYRTPAKRPDTPPANPVTLRPPEPVTPPDTGPDILSDLVAVWPATERTDSGRCHIADLSDSLAKQWPDVYAGMGSRGVAALARPLGFVAPQMKIGNRNKPGIRWESLLDAYVAREAVGGGVGGPVGQANRSTYPYPPTTPEPQ